MGLTLHLQLFVILFETHIQNTKLSSLGLVLEAVINPQSPAACHEPHSSFLYWRGMRQPQPQLLCPDGFGKIGLHRRVKREILITRIVLGAAKRVQPLPPRAMGLLQAWQGMPRLWDHSGLGKCKVWLLLLLPNALFLTYVGWLCRCLSQGFTHAQLGTYSPRQRRGWRSRGR